MASETSNTGSRKNTYVANWAMADFALQNSDFADFEADDCEFDEATGEHKYFGDDGTMVTVDRNANVLIGMTE